MPEAIAEPTADSLRSRRWIFLALAIAALVVLGFTGVLGARNDAEITKAEALDIAATQLDFEPTLTEIRLLRNGFSMRPVWAVSYAIEDPAGGPGDYLRQTTVELDARSGDVLRVGSDDGG